MEILTKKFHPLTFDLDKIEPINSAFIKNCHIGEENMNWLKENPTSLTLNILLISLRMANKLVNLLFMKRRKKRFCVEKNRVVFLHDTHICFLDIYIKPNYQILPVITVEFATEEEMDSYKPEQWFGQEVNEKFYNEKALWYSLQAVPK